VGEFPKRRYFNDMRPKFNKNLKHREKSVLYAIVAVHETKDHYHDEVKARTIMLWLLLANKEDV
jgi:hypothetical protein